MLKHLMLSPQPGDKAGIHALSTSIQHCTDGPSHYNKKKKRFWVGKEFGE